MKKNIKLLGTVLLTGMMAALALNAYAIVYEGERPIYAAQMKKTDARGYFEGATRIHLMMTQLDSSEEPTGLTLTYVLSSKNNGMDKPALAPQEVQLMITEKRDIGCGSVQYIAQLNELSIMNPMDAPYSDHRFSVILTDHTRRVCEDYRPNTWEASVREGYGWCGTFDATMNLVGNPQVIYTIQDIQ